MPTSERLPGSDSAFLAFALLALFAVPWSRWRDPSTHIQKYVETEPGVRLEVLDWGGTGQPILLLAGHGDSGHIFDNFAPGLTNSFHVLALTRRGFGASSQPQHGYDLTTMVRDIARVLQRLNLRGVNLVGHSIAGDEMTRFAMTYPNRVRKLVYLEAAYDRVEAQQLESKFPKILPSPPETLEAGSPEEVRAKVAQAEILMPEGEIRATRIFGSDGRFVRPVTPEAIVDAVAKMVEHPEYGSIRVPMLAVYAVYKTPAQLIARYNVADEETRRALEQVFALWQPFAKSEREFFRKSVPRARVVEMEDASHYIFLSNQEQVTREVRAFLQAP